VVVNKFVIIKYRNTRFIQGINYGIVSGTLTAHTFLFAKSIIDVLLQSLLNKSNIFTNFTPYLLLAIMLSIIGLQLTAFNLGLAKISTSVLYPLCFLVFNLFNLINDLMFNELLPEKMTYSQLHKVIFGLTSVLCGVVLLSWDGFWAQPEEELQVIIRHNLMDYGTIRHPIKRTLSFEKNQIVQISS
jgi:multidrug transporter EmrE-like cation transporter